MAEVKPPSGLLSPLPTDIPNPLTSAIPTLQQISLPTPNRSAYRPPNRPIYRLQGNPPTFTTTPLPVILQNTSPGEVRRLADISKTITRFMRMMFTPNKTGENVYGSRQKNPLDRSHVEQIRQILITVYGESMVPKRCGVSASPQ